MAAKTIKHTFAFVAIILASVFSAYSYTYKTKFKTDSVLYAQNDKQKNILTSIELLKKRLDEKEIDSIDAYKNLAFFYAHLNDANKATYYLEKHIKNTAEINILHDQFFKKIKTTENFKKLEHKYLLKVSFWSSFYLFSGCIGVFIALLLLFKINNNHSSNIFIGLFVLLHSLFILHISLFISNYLYKTPHFLYITTTFSLLYGPLLYFYFKKRVTNYNLTAIDALHFLPTLILLGILVPYYTLDAESKLLLMVNRNSDLKVTTTLIVLAKIISLSVYAYLIHKLYLKYKHQNTESTAASIKWQSQLKNIFIAYVFVYSLHGLGIIFIGNSEGVASFQPQVIAMALLIFYIASTAYTVPEVFGKKTNSAIKTKVNNNNLPDKKYKKSALTPAYSIELKQELIKLLNEYKVYKENNLNLEMLAAKLGTTKHNTSQVINEHFNMNFFELINKYRIQEATTILKNNYHITLNIIDVAYEVGYNNKVTFNKAFKKETSLTPTEYLDKLHKLKYV